MYFIRREGGGVYGGKSHEASIRGGRKLMQNDPYSPLELNQLKDDPQEKMHVIKDNPQIARELQLALRVPVQRGDQTPWQPPPRSGPNRRTLRRPAVCLTCSHRTPSDHAHNVPLVFVT